LGLVKKRVAKINKAAKCNVQTRHIVRIDWAFHPAANTANVLGISGTQGSTSSTWWKTRRLQSCSVW
jgi:hypothetical protein